MVNVWSMTKKNCFKNPFFAKNAIFSKIMSQSQDCFWLIQAPYLEMEELQLRLLEKQLTTKFFILGQKGHFFSKNVGTIKKKVIALNMYIGSNVLVYERWLMLKVQFQLGPLAQHFCHSIDLHCLCM